MVTIKFTLYVSDTRHTNLHQKSHGQRYLNLQEKLLLHVDCLFSQCPFLLKTTFCTFQLYIVSQTAAETQKLI